MERLIWLLLAYWRTRRLSFSSRAALEAYQARQLAQFSGKLCKQSRYFAPFVNLPLSQWPTMNKAIMLANFDAMNTAGLRKAKVFEVALASEHSRDFTPSLGGITLGLSSGTSSQRGVFAVSEKEKATWAGVMLAKALPDGLLAGERVALFLRANSNLYTAVRTPWLSFAFFDLFKPFDQLIADIALYRPSIIVAPAQVLRQLSLSVMAGKLNLAPKRVISVAEVLEPQGRALIEQAFGPAHEIYQATEGFLASTCERGVLHLNEEYVHVDPQWLDDEQHRFVPIITDFSRMTQPIVRYRLDDILVARATPCDCGRVTRALDRIEGRCDDLLMLPGMHCESIAVFSDMLSRTLAQALPLDADYQLIQHGEASLALHAAVGIKKLEMVRDHAEKVLRHVGVNTARLMWTLSDVAPIFDPTAKRRRIVREHFALTT